MCRDHRGRIAVRNVYSNRLSYVPEWRLLRAKGVPVESRRAAMQPEIPLEIHTAIDRAMSRVVALMCACITNAVEPTGADDPHNIAGAVKAVEDALIRIEAALTPKPLPVIPYSQQGPA